MAGLSVKFTALDEISAKFDNMAKAGTKATEAFSNMERTGDKAMDNVASNMDNVTQGMKNTTTATDNCSDAMEITTVPVPGRQTLWKNMRMPAIRYLRQQKMLPAISHR